MKTINSSKERADSGKKRYKAPTLKEHPVLANLQRLIKFKNFKYSV